MGLGLYVQSRYGIGGVIYEQLGVQKEFLSAVDPAVIRLTQPVLVLQSMETETNRDELSRQIVELQGYESEYRATREKFLKSLPDGEARRLLERDIQRPAEELFQIARSEYIPLLQQGQAADRQRPPRFFVVKSCHDTKRFAGSVSGSSH